MTGMKNGLLAAAVLLVACGQAIPGNGSADAKASTSGEKKLDVAGLTIGMSVPQTVAVLKAAGWSLTEDKGYSWEQDVNNELSRQNVAGRQFDYNKKGVGSLIGIKGDERVVVEFSSAPPPLMGRIKEVRYDAPAPGRTAQQMVAELSRKYGAPDHSGAPGLSAGATWCVAGPVCANGRGFGTRTVLVGGQRSLGMGGGMAIRMIQGREASALRDAELLRATASAAGARGKPSY
jgi:hypothetical protein